MTDESKIEDGSYLSMLKEGMNFESIEEVKDKCCINIETELFPLTLCFIDFETKNHLGLFCTHPDGTERFTIIPKNTIKSVAIVYEQDVFPEDIKDPNYV